MRWLGIIISLSRSRKTDFLFNLTCLLFFLQHTSDFVERPINLHRAIRQIHYCSRSGWKGLLPLDSFLFSSWHVCLIRRNLDLIDLQEEPLNRRRTIRQIVPDQVGNLKVRCKNDVLWFRLDFNAASVFQAYPNDPLANIEHWPVNHQSLGCYCADKLWNI